MPTVSLTLLLLVLLSLNFPHTSPFLLAPSFTPRSTSLASTPPPTTPPTSLNSLQSQASTLRKIIAKEYSTFFQPIYPEYYSPTVSFTDPMVSFTGLSKYESNIATIGGRNLLGSLLFGPSDSRIILHTITGGDVTSASSSSPSFTDIVTRWTLTATFKPTQSRIIFTGISTYNVKLQNDKVIVSDQLDSWDSINLQPGGTYLPVSTLSGIKDFVDQAFVKGPSQKVSDSEIPYLTVRRAKDYTVRKYPASTWIQIPYDRREEGYEKLGRVVKGYENKVLKPCRFDINDKNSDSKIMSWCIGYGDDPSIPPSIQTSLQSFSATIQTSPERTVAVLNIPEATPNTVKTAEQQLIKYLETDGLTPSPSSSLVFAQYDEVFKMGKRRVEVWKDVTSIWN